MKSAKKSIYQYEITFKDPSVFLLLIARLIDLLIASLPMIIFYIFYKINDLKSALIVFSIYHLIIFFYFVMIPYFFSGNTVGKWIFNLRLKLDNKNKYFSKLLLREFYYLYIPFIVQILANIISIVIFKYYNPGENDSRLNGWTLSFIVRNIGNIFLSVWFFYIAITVYLNKNNRSAIDSRFGINVKLLSKKLIINNKNDKKIIEVNHPGVFNMEDVLKNDLDNFSNINSLINSWVDSSFINGAVLIIKKNNKILLDKQYGYNDIFNNVKMKRDQIFRGYSITKILTAIATLILVEKNLLSLEDDVSIYLPQFKKLKVIDNGIIKPITNKLKIKNLLTMTSGLAYGGKKTHTEKETEKLLIKLRNKDLTYDEFIEELSTIPLEFEPGTNWKYGISYDVLSAIIEKVSKQSFRDFVKQSILDKLDMQDTDFYIKDKDREALVYKLITENENNKLEELKNFNFLLQDLYNQPIISMGGSGLFTTCPDYLNFLSFLLTGKDNQGQTIISNKMLALMRSDQVLSLKKYLYMNINDDYSYGYGVRVRLNNSIEPLTTIGQFGWDGLLGSSCIIDPKNEVILCFMTSVKQNNDTIVRELQKSLYEDLKKA